jgi:predicted house-cleaning noncanonical NTP pyrophosphatase (MazG superfamily)
MRKFEIKKLVRDKIIKNIHKNELAKTKSRILKKKELLEALKNKFKEEIEELEFTDVEKSKKELADLQLIIDSLLENLKINKKELREVCKKKNQKVGKFKERIFLEEVELDENDEWLSYYEKKYKEIK